MELNEPIRTIWRIFKNATYQFSSVTLTDCKDVACHVPSKHITQ
jgi:hypothetical protein